jgi:Ca2+-binding RTX toxin-like protein
MRRVWIAAAVAGVLLAHPAPGDAATASVTESCGKGGGVTCFAHLWVAAAPGERNDVRVTPVGDDLLVSDSTPVIAEETCEARPDGSALCHPRNGRPWIVAHLELGDLDDSAAVAGDLVGAAYDGGSGDDRLLGGPAGSSFRGGSGDDVMVGGEGDDFFDEGGAPNGNDVMSGGGQTTFGNPPLRMGDVVSYADRVRPVRAVIGGRAEGGERGEHDRIGADVEVLLGGHAGDTLTGDASADYLNGAHGDDVLRGRGGEDLLYGSRGNDRIFDGRGIDRVRAGPGRDRIRSGAGPDDIAAGPGNDVIWTRGGPEPVDCGGGWDRVFASPLDQLTEDCERRMRRR